MAQNLLKATWLKDLSGAWIFYTILPGLPWVKPSFKRIARFAPIIGLTIGTFQSGIWICLNHFNWPNISISLIILAFGILITGGIHFDGLIDTFDGIAAGEENSLIAMKDSRIGAIGLQVFIITILIQIASMVKLGELIIVALPIASFWGRYSPLWAMQYFPYLHKKHKREYHKTKSNLLTESKPALVSLLMILTLLTFCSIEIGIKNQLILLFIISIVPTLIVPQCLGTRLKGHSGDTYGASTVLVETCILLMMGLILPTG